MKKNVLYILLALFFFGWTNTHAQDFKPGQMQENMRRFLKDTVKLTPGQTDSVMAARKEFMPQLKEFYKNDSLSVADKQAKMKDLRSKLEEKYKAAGLKQEQIEMINDHDKVARQEIKDKMKNRQKS